MDNSPRHTPDGKNPTMKGQVVPALISDVRSQDGGHLGCEGDREQDGALGYCNTLTLDMDVGYHCVCTLCKFITTYGFVHIAVRFY